MEIYDITIIGGGPVGLFASFYAGMRQAKTKIIESLEELGGQPRFLYPEKKIYDIPAHPEVNGEDLTKDLLRQMKHFQTTLCLGETVETIDPVETEEGLIYRLQTPKQTHYSKTIIIAAGNGAFQPRRIQDPLAQKYEHESVHYHVKPLDYYQDQVVAIAGGGDSAVDWALALEQIAKKVYLIHRRPQFRAMEHSTRLLHQSSVEILTPYVIDHLVETDDHLSGLALNKVRSEETLDLAIDQLIISYGFVSSIGGIRQWELKLERNAIVVDNKLRTNRPGIYAIGDIAHYDGKLKLIATGFGEGPTAVNQALLYIDPDRRPQSKHISDLF